jgi:hypothetical protein
VEAKTLCPWIPGLALLARNDGRGAFVIPAEAGIQGHSAGMLFLRSATTRIRAIRGSIFLFLPRVDG